MVLEGRDFIAREPYPVIEYAKQETEAVQEMLPELRYVEGVVKLSDGLILIQA